ncbi:hypothetical protein [Aeromonas jandaei]|uniref:hypothetical protein n=1 Tax=Aeromonas jandaei TaxID=650 RepID=UPI001ABEEF70|nr:hypothetical protein [Aeromonas jandaei]QSR71082.1 hypothetical protein GP488_00905 [Aeromonas jandaei]QTL95103.1 hypothetical protein AjGTCBM29_02998 [Aeromonas jandaei]
MRYLLLLSLLWTLPALAESESHCQQAFVDWMLHQQQQFSDRKADKMTRRRAERAIDLARQEYDKAGSFCQTMQLVSSYNDGDPRLTPRSGEIHDFAPAS